MDSVKNKKTVWTPYTPAPVKQNTLGAKIPQKVDIAARTGFGNGRKTGNLPTEQTEKGDGVLNLLTNKEAASGGKAAVDALDKLKASGEPISGKAFISTLQETLGPKSGKSDPQQVHRILQQWVEKNQDTLGLDARFKWRKFDEWAQPTLAAQQSGGLDIYNMLVGHTLTSLALESVKYERPESGLAVENLHAALAKGKISGQAIEEALTGSSRSIKNVEDMRAQHRDFSSFMGSTPPDQISPQAWAKWESYDKTASVVHQRKAIDDPTKTIAEMRTQLSQAEKPRFRDRLAAGFIVRLEAWAELGKEINGPCLAAALDRTTRGRHVGVQSDVLQDYSQFVKAYGKHLTPQAREVWTAFAKAVDEPG